MRSRKEIEVINEEIRETSTSCAGAKSDVRTGMIIELLLDIRGILQKLEGQKEKDWKHDYLLKTGKKK